MQQIMAQNENALIWIDMEMSGLSPLDDQILEVALVVTDAELNVVAEAPVLVVHQDDAILGSMDDWNKSTHAKSGLLDRVRNSRLTAADVESRMVSFLEPLVPRGVSPMCGNSVCQDRRFLARHMPALESFFHYRNLDVSTLKELTRRWRPDLVGKFVKQGKHEALADVYESIEELKFYREHFVRLNGES
jgi:oligoribonuclease